MSILQDFDYYQEKVTQVKRYKGNPNLYLLGKLTEESGEIAKEIVNRIDGKVPKKDLTSELGDLLWVISAIAENHGIKMSDVVRQNLEKLKDRDLL